MICFRISFGGLIKKWLFVNYFLLQRYKTARVDHVDGIPGEGTFLLHQGIQRRVAMTIVHESGMDLMWHGMEEMVIGRVRNSSEWNEPDNEHSILSLNLSSSHYIKQHDDDDRWRLNGSENVLKLNLYRLP